MERLNPRSRRDEFGSKINRDTSPLLTVGLPWLTIMLGSLSPMLPVIALAPVLPPFAYIAMVAWRLLRPGVLPLWAGLPLGLFNDLLSGQPLGSGVLLFSVTMIAIDLVDIRFPWRSFWQDWLTASLFITAYLVLAGLTSGADLTLIQLRVILPQLLISVVLFPPISRLVSLFDRLRLLRVRRLA